MKKLSAVCLALVLTLFAAAATAYADGEAARGHSHCICGKADCTQSHLVCGKTSCKTHSGTEAAGNVQWKAWDGDTSVGSASDASAGAVYLYLENDVTIQDTLSVANVTVYLCLHGKTLTIEKAGYPAIRVEAGKKLVLCDCVGTGKITGATGSAKGDTTRAGAINGQAGSTIVMYGGSIVNNEVAAANGGGVSVFGGAFAMHAGSISGNKAPGGSGGAIAVQNGELDIYGGELAGNSAINGGAIHLAGGTKAYLYDVKVDRNSASSRGGAVHVEGENTYLRLHGAELSYNTAVKHGGGVYGCGDYNLVVDLYGGTIHGNRTTTGSGGGMYIEDASLNMMGGSISDNRCDSSSGNGGGICLVDANMSRSSGSDPNYDSSIVGYISGNTAGGRGGGIYVSSGQISYTKKLEIRGNTAANEGGGMYIRGTFQWLILGETTITENTALQGGGVYLNNGNSGRELEFYRTVSILGNTLAADGAANNLYLNNGKMFQFRSGMGGETRIGVSVSNAPTVDEPTGIVYKGDMSWSDGGDHTNLIVPDSGSYMVVYNSQSQMHYLAPCCTVTIDPNNGDEPQAIKVKTGGALSQEQLTSPTHPSGYDFDAWYAGGAPYDFTQPVTRNITLTAKWVVPNETKLTVTAEQIAVLNLDRPAVLYAAAYRGGRLLDVKLVTLGEAAQETVIAINAAGTQGGITLNTERATKIVVFLWDGNMVPLCGCAAAQLTAG